MGLAQVPPPQPGFHMLSRISGADHTKEGFEAGGPSPGPGPGCSPLPAGALLAPVWASGEPEFTETMGPEKFLVTC